MSEPTPSPPAATAPPVGVPEGDDVQVAFDVGDLPGGARGAIEAVLMIVEEPVTDHALSSALELPVEEIREHLGALEEAYADGRHGFTVRNVGGGWRFYSHHAYAPVVERVQTHPLEEVRGRPVERRIGLLVLGDLDDEAAGEEGAYDSVDVDPADRADARPRDRLPVGDDGEGLELSLIHI